MVVYCLKLFLSMPLTDSTVLSSTNFYVYWFLLMIKEWYEPNDLLMIKEWYEPNDTCIHERIMVWIMVWVLPEVLVVSMKGIDKRSHGKSLAWRLAFVTHLHLPYSWMELTRITVRVLPDDLLLLHTYTCHIHEWNGQESLLRFLPEDLK